MRQRMLILAMLAVSLMPAQARAQGAKLDEAKVKVAIEKGIKWIKTRQKGDGTFDEGYRSQFPIGPTALATLTLIKTGHASDSETKKALAQLRQATPSKTYGTGILLMALEALYAPSKDQMKDSDKPLRTVTRKQFKRAKPIDKKQVSAAVDWLLKSRHKPMWGYPFGGASTMGLGGGEWDHSNTQYALLGLGAASRLGWKAKPRPLYEVLEQILAGQEKTGPKVEPFFVPAADAPFGEIEKLARDLAKARARERKGKAGGTVPRIRDFYETYTAKPMNARGWAYFPVGGGGPRNPHPAMNSPQFSQVGNSMTAAGLAITIVLKSMLEKAPGYKRYRKAVDQAIRDGAAYLAHNWTLEDQGHPLYYLYGLERVGVFTGCERFGKHDWYVEGGKKILAEQAADGSWGSAAPVMAGGLAQKPNALPQTCFAILFLARASVPLIPKLPERPTTGGGGKKSD